MMLSTLPQRYGAYGYWIDPYGDILPVDVHGGHVVALIDHRGIDRCLHTADIYDHAFKAGYVRIVAGTANRSCFEMQYKYLTTAARQSLASLLVFLPEYSFYSQRDSAGVVVLGDYHRIQFLIEKKMI